MCTYHIIYLFQMIYFKNIQSFHVEIQLHLSLFTKVSSSHTILHSVGADFLPYIQSINDTLKYFANKPIKIEMHQVRELRELFLI